MNTRGRGVRKLRKPLGPKMQATIQEILAAKSLEELTKEEYEMECKHAAAQFAVADPGVVSSYDGDWEAFPLPEDVMVAPGNAPYNTNRLLLRSTKPVVSIDDCNTLVEIARLHGEKHGWDQRYPIADNTEEVNVADSPAANKLLGEILTKTLLPEIGKQYPFIDTSSLRVTTALIIKYDAETGKVNLPIHRDHSLFTLNIALSDPSEYDGGGVWFQHTNSTLVNPQGHMVIHAGRVTHSGVPVVRGSRHQLVMFVISTDHPDRCEVAKSLETQLLQSGTQEDLRLAVNVLEQSLQWNERDMDVLSILAGHYYTLGRTNAAIQTLQRLVEFSGGRDFNALYMLSKLYSGLQDFDKASSVLQQAKDVGAPPGTMQEMENLRTIYKLGVAQFQSAQYEDAAKHLLEVVKKQENFTEAWQVLAECMTRLGKKKKARKYQEMAAKYR